MRVVIIILFIFFNANAHGQSLVEKLANVSTSKQAKKFISNNPLFQGRILQIDSNTDTSLLNQQLYGRNAGDIFTIGAETYKVIVEKSTMLSRASYIFLDGAHLSVSQIDTVRKFILKQYNKGVSFDSLVAKYNMDGNGNGDTDWFAEGVMAKEFSDAVKQHHLSDVFNVDVPASHWYFVVKKTYETKSSKRMIILQLNTVANK